MIEELKISNFQSHKKTELKFSKGINMIVGKSDSGKTAIIRALRWVVENRPSGDAFRSHWGGETEVYLKTNSSLFVERIKGKENLYNSGQIFNNQKDIVEEFKSFGQDVPEEIKKILNFSSLNLQNQFDAPFLLADSAGEVAKYLNKIAHLDTIDLSMKNITRTINRETSNIGISENRIIELKNKEEGYKWLKEAEDRMIVLEGERKELVRYRKSNDKLQETIEGIEDCENRLKKYTDLDKKKATWEKADALYRKIETRENSIFKLEKLIIDLQYIDNALKDIEKAIPLYEKDFAKLMTGVCPLCGRGDNNDD